MSGAGLISHTPISQAFVTLAHASPPPFSPTAPNPGPAAPEAATLPPSQRDAGDTDSSSVQKPVSPSPGKDRQILCSTAGQRHLGDWGLTEVQLGACAMLLGACAMLLGLQVCLHRFPHHYVVSLYFTLGSFGALFCRTRVLGKYPSLELQLQPKHAS